MRRLRTVGLDEARDVVVVTPRRGLPELMHRALADTGARAPSESVR